MSRKNRGDQRTPIGLVGGDDNCRRRVHPLRLCGVALATLLLAACGQSRDPAPIPSKAADAPRLIGSAADPQPIRAELPPANPYMGQPGVNSMHANGYSSDAQAQPGPLGHDPEVVSRKHGGLLPGACPITTITHSGKLIVLCGALFHFKFELLNPKTLKLLASYSLPTRPSSYHALFTFNPDYIMSDTSGAYFYLDNEDRIVFADARQHIVRIAVQHNDDGTWRFNPENDWDMSGYLPHDCWGLFHWFPEGTCDPITGVLPDREGRIWWASRHGRVGVLNPDSGAVSSIHLDEEIENGFSVDHNGVYLVTDHAMYGLNATASDEPHVLWREAYDRGKQRKVGSVSQGSGTVPTLLGKRYVAITDNADPRINLLVYRRRPQVDGKRLVCKVPLFQPGASATENSIVSLKNALIIENNAGYTSAFEQSDWGGIAGGIWRVNVQPRGKGCRVAWRSREKSPSVVPKLSAANGLVYFYTFKPAQNGKNAWYLMALDFATGETRFKIRTGVGSSYDNNWSPITLGPDGTAYVGTYKGMVAIREGG